MNGGTFNPQSLYSEHRGVSDRGDSYQVVNEICGISLSTTTSLSVPSPSVSRSPSLSSSSPTVVHCQSNSNEPSMESHCICDHDQYPAPHTFASIVQDYLQRLSIKKRDKALVNHERYQVILQVLKDPRNTSIGTAQFRFWVKKMFQLSTTSITNDDRQHNQPSSTWVVCHHGKPVAIQEQIYDILIHAHREAHHGGRDKTSAKVRKYYSWIPKELTARFVQNCPFCISRRNGYPGRPSCNHSTLAPHTLTPATKKGNLTFIKEEIYQKLPTDNILTDNNNSNSHNYNHQQRQSHLDFYDDSFTALPLKSNPANYSYHQQHQYNKSIMTPPTPTDAGYTSGTNAANISTQWIEPGVPVYYYKKSPSSDILYSTTAMNLHPHNATTSMRSCAYPSCFVDQQISPSDNSNSSNATVSPDSALDSIISQCQQVPDALQSLQSEPYSSWPTMSPLCTTIE